MPPAISLATTPTSQASSSARSRSRSTSRRRSVARPVKSSEISILTSRNAASPRPRRASNAPANRKSQHKSDAHIEFGGAVGASFIIVVSHVLLYYVYYCLFHNDGDLWLPRSWAEAQVAIATTARSAAPNLIATTLYFGFLAVEMALALFTPGMILQGRADETGRKLTYNCNALLSWYITLAGIAGLHVTGIFRLSSYLNHFGSVMTVAILFADFQSIAWYAYAVMSGKTHRMTGNAIYDFFMGAILHPRLFGGRLDVKMFAEVRMSWFLLFVLTASACVKAWESGELSPSMLFIAFAQFMYANATSKGEHYVPPTWDITYEKYGWMLCFWNFAGVPFLYCKGAIWLAKHGGRPSTPLHPAFLLLLFVVYCIAYYVWDSAQSQKSHFRLERSGSDVPDRFTLPRLPWRTIRNPRHIVTKLGTPLLVDGWWAYARKVHYSADVMMALTWALCTGFGAGLPYIYPAFFVTMISHRYLRDDAKCARNYGDDWKRYTELVPYAFVPGLF